MTIISERVRFRRERRHKDAAGRAQAAFLFEEAPVAVRSSGRLVQAGLRKQLVAVVNRPARYLPSGPWPCEIQADLAAALLDFPTTYALCKAISRGEAPAPTATRRVGSRVEPVWSTDEVRCFTANRHCAPGSQGAPPQVQE